MKKITDKNKITKDWFKDWANEYDATLGKLKRHHDMLDLVVESSKVKTGDRVLDIGCGTGLLSLKFLKKADCVVTGVDSSTKMLAICRKKIKQLGLNRKITCRLVDAEQMDFPDDAFDIIASTVTLHHIQNKTPVFKKIHRILKPGGRFVLGDWDMDTTGSLTDPKRMLRILDFLKQEFALALNEGGIPAFIRMYDNGKKHILNEGEYCVSFKQWKELCLKAEFKKVAVQPVPNFEWFNVLTAIK
jgi:ubiquinone/menaquinone biosynthesis C-methylase UbiE